MTDAGFRSATVFIDRYYDDPFELDPPWPRRRRWPGDPLWGAWCEYGATGEGAEFESVDDGIAWGRERAERVFVRLGADNDSCYTAGVEQGVQVSGGIIPTWPPDHWPDYLGPEHETRRWSNSKQA